MPAGEIWLAGAGGSCDDAGSCASGPCGQGTIITCPDPWSDTYSLAVSYTKGAESLYVGGRPYSVGDRILSSRSITDAAQFAYDVEYYRGALPGSPAAVTPPGKCMWLEITLPYPGYATGWSAWLVGGPCPRGNNWMMAFSWNNSGQLVGSGGRLLSVSGDIITALTNVSDPFGYGYTLPTGGKMVRDGVSNNYDATVVADDPGGCLSWGVTTAFGSGFGQTTYESLPDAAAPGTFELGWGERMFFDQIRVVALPPQSISFTASLTLRSACEEPAP